MEKVGPEKGATVEGSTRDVILYGALPEPLYVLRIPIKGEPWRKITQAVGRLVKSLTNTPAHKAPPRHYLDGDAPAWNPGKWASFVYERTTQEFIRATE